MTTINSIVLFLNQELNIHKIADTSRNGLQVKAGPKHIQKIAFAVDASLETFKLAKKAGADLLIVHHGIFWKGAKDSTGTRKTRLTQLKKFKLHLYACHLPLDMHPECGNNIGLARILGLHNLKPFGKYHGLAIGFQGKFKKPVSLKNLTSVLNRTLNTRSILLNFGKPKVKSIGIVSGGGGSVVANLKKEKVDCFITGEAQHYVYHEAKDMKQNIILAGHYATETVGVKLLMPLLQEKFKLKTIFIGYPTGF
ncbi:MAG: Nif3-like dinuclear metal center hexameric protein [Pseudomonadota bacterium]